MMARTSSSSARRDEEPQILSICATCEVKRSSCAQAFLSNKRAICAVAHPRTRGNGTSRMGAAFDQLPLQCTSPRARTPHHEPSASGIAAMKSSAPEYIGCRTYAYGPVDPAHRNIPFVVHSSGRFIGRAVRDRQRVRVSKGETRHIDQSTRQATSSLPSAAVRMMRCNSVQL
jgi:hypothetical protein